jgi:hypothetical protein
MQTAYDWLNGGPLYPDLCALVAEYGKTGYVRTLRGHRKEVICAALVDGWLVTCAYDGVRRWDLATGEGVYLDLTTDLGEALPREFGVMAVLPGAFVITENHLMHVWSSKTWSYTHTLHGHCRIKIVTPLGSMLATASADDTVRVWSLTKQLRSVTLDTGMVSRILLLSNGLLAVASYEVHIIDPSDCTVVRTLITDSLEIPTAVVEHGDTLLVGYMDGVVRKFCFVSGLLLDILRNPSCSADSVCELDFVRAIVPTADGLAVGMRYATEFYPGDAVAQPGGKMVGLADDVLTAFNGAVYAWKGGCRKLITGSRIDFLAPTEAGVFAGCRDGDVHMLW